MKASEFDKKFDSDIDITEDLDLTRVKRVNLSIQKIDLELPAWMLDKLDDEAKRIGVNRQSLVKFWISEKLDTL